MNHDQVESRGLYFIFDHPERYDRVWSFGLEYPVWEPMRFNRFHTTTYVVQLGTRTFLVTGFCASDAFPTPSAIGLHPILERLSPSRDKKVDVRS